MTFTTEKTNLFLYLTNFAQCDAYAPDPYASCSTQWEVDDSGFGDAIYSTNILNAYNMIEASGPYDVEAGEHTVKLRWKVGSAN